MRNFSPALFGGGYVAVRYLRNQVVADSVYSHCFAFVLPCAPDVHLGVEADLTEESGVVAAALRVCVVCCAAADYRRDFAPRRKLYRAVDAVVRVGAVRVQVVCARHRVEFPEVCVRRKARLVCARIENLHRLNVHADFGQALLDNLPAVRREAREHRAREKFAVVDRLAEVVGSLVVVKKFGTEVARDKFVAPIAEVARERNFVVECLLMPELREEAVRADFPAKRVLPAYRRDAVVVYIRPLNPAAEHGVRKFRIVVCGGSEEHRAFCVIVEQHPRRDVAKSVIVKVVADIRAVVAVIARARVYIERRPLQAVLVVVRDVEERHRSYCECCVVHRQNVCLLIV